LKVLNISSTLVRNIDELKSLPDLRELDISDLPNLGNLNILLELKTLTVLYIGGVWPSGLLKLSKKNLNRLAKCDQVKELYLNNSRGLESVDFLKDMKNLEVLSIYDTDVEDVSLLKDLPLKKLIRGGRLTLKNARKQLPNVEDIR